MHAATTLRREPRPAALALAVLAALVLAGCGGGKSDAPPAARVNKQEISAAQVDLVLQQQRGLRPEFVEAAGKQILERLIDQQLAVQKAEQLKLDRDPRVQSQLDAVRSEVLARAYRERLGEAAPKPTAEEVRKYFEDKPALFSERRIYNIQEFAIEARPEQLVTLREQLAAARNVGEFLEFLKANDFRYGGNQAVRPAEQLPLQSLDALSRMKDGQAVLSPTGTGATVIVLAGSRSQPVSLEQARPAIELYLLNERKRKLVEEDIKALRGTAKIEYLGKFTGGPGVAASAPALPASAASGS